MRYILPEKSEIKSRIEKLHGRLAASGKAWDAAFIFDRVTQYYFTGSMQDGVFVLKSDGSYKYFVRRSFERAQSECLIDEVSPMVSYREVREGIGDVKRAFLDSSVVTLEIMGRLEKYFTLDETYSLDGDVARLRAVKSEYELEQIRQSGRRHAALLDEAIPALLSAAKDGPPLDEAMFTANIFYKMIELGHQGVSRFLRFQTEMITGQTGFGTNTLHPTSFDGPGGMKGMCPAVSLIGDRDRILKTGDLVFADIGFGYNGYHSDRTQVYMFGAEPDEDTVRTHMRCLEIQRHAASLLKPGAVPAEIFETVLREVEPEFLEGFPGYGSATVKFLGHGVGLNIDEYPVIARGFSEPLEKNMVIALEPKKGVAGVGMTGDEDTYIVTENGGELITFGEKPIMVI